MRSRARLLPSRCLATTRRRRPSPISIAGPPSTTSFAPGPGTAFSTFAGAHVAQAASDHDRLVIAAPRAAGRQQRGAEVAGEIRPAELVVEARGADRAVEHDRERRRDTVGLARQRSLPRLAPARDLEVRDREAREPCLRLGAAAGRTLVADLAARARRGAGIRRDRRRMVVRLDLHHEVRGLVDVAVHARLRIRTEPTARLAPRRRRRCPCRRTARRRARAHKCCGSSRTGSSARARRRSASPR